MRYSYLLASSAALLLSACQSVEAPTNAAIPVEMPTIAAMPVEAATSAHTIPAAMVEGNNAFGWDLYKELTKTEDGNIFISPASISGAFGLLYPGAVGDTAAQMEERLGFQGGMTGFPADLKQFNHELTETGENATLTIANAVWVNKKRRLNAEYADAMRTQVGAKIEAMNFKKPKQTSETINAWVEDNTNDRIKDLVPADAITHDLAMVLTNAVWFYADWSDPFGEHNTETKTFYAPDGEIDVEMMQQRADVQHVKSRQYSAIDLGYEGDDFTMTIILPKNKDGLERVTKSMTANRLAKLLTRIDSAPTKLVDIKLPKAKIEADYSLKRPIKAIGLTTVFDTPEIPHLTDTPVGVSGVLHKTFLEMDEEGTEAAATTAIVVTVSSERVDYTPPEPILFNVEHPYLIVLRDKATGAIVFIGHIENPTGK